MLQNNNFTHTEGTILSIVNKAGYQELTPVQQKVIPPFLEGKDIVLETKNARGKTAAFILPLLQLLASKDPGIKAVVITPDSLLVRKVERQFRLFTNQFSSPLEIASVGYEKNIKKELARVKKKPDILVGTAHRVIDHLRRENISLSNVRIAVIYQISQQMNNAFTRDVQYIFSKIEGKPQMILFIPRLIEDDILALFPRKPAILTLSASDRPEQVKSRHLQETNQMSLEKKKDTGKETVVKKIAEGILKKIKEEENPEELNKYKKYIRQHVPLSLRSYFAAYLFKESLGSHSVEDEESTALFVSIGKNRKVYPRDLSRLFHSSLGIDRDQIGEIKILDNYSFIEVPVSQAERAITLLNGTEFRGRKITVNHARKKEE